MKSKKYIIKSLTVLSIIMVSSVSCKKSFLDETNYSTAQSSTYFTTRSGYESLVNASYSGLRTIYNSKEYQNLTELGTDLVTQNYPGAISSLNQYAVTYDANEGNVLTYWSNLYIALKNINAVVDRAPKVLLKTDNPDGIDPLVLPQRVAEGKALRAMLLFEIVRNWGKGPLVINETNTPTTEATISDGPAFYSQILKDLNDAIAVLPLKQTGANYGRMSASAAKHLRALVYLTRGYQSYADANDFTNAYNDAVDVITKSGYSLLADYQQVHRQSNETNNEILFSVGWSNSANNNLNNFPSWYLFPYREGYTGLSKSALYSNDNVFGMPTKFAYLMFDWQNDRRAEVTFMSPVNGTPATSTDGRDLGKDWFQATIAATVTVNGSPVTIPVGDTTLYLPVPTDPNYRQWTAEQRSHRRYKIYNYPTGDATDFSADDYYKNGYQSSNGTTRTWLPVWKFKDANTIYNENGAASGTRDTYLYRLAETYLIAAEAAVKKGDNGNALFYLNKIRTRAEKLAGSLQKNGTVTIDDILDERALELFGEVPRWNDLQRTKKLNERVLKYNWDATHITGGVSTQLTLGSTKFYLRPIPVSWINSVSNNSSITNNPGW